MIPSLFKSLLLQPSAKSSEDPGAQYMAGYLYQVTGLDKRDHIQDCYQQSEYINDNLGNIISSMSSGEFTKAKEYMIANEPLYNASLESCTDA